MKNIVFDAYPVLVWIKGESGSEKVVSLLEEARDGKIKSFICQINLGEVYYKVIRAKGIEQAKIFIDTFRLLPVKIITITEDLVWTAAEIKAKFAISYADCFAVATAIKQDAVILTGDPEFKKVEKIVEIEWL
ncbi:MAG: type II toxin-antitoxin system VapC family toxin [bacterium]